MDIPKCGWPKNLPIHTPNHLWCDFNAAGYFGNIGLYKCPQCGGSEWGLLPFKAAHVSHMMIRERERETLIHNPTCLNMPPSPPV